ncbi:MAG: malonyl-ACP O-methyltransferase BioC [Gammaproteobacteria bacterium]|nr:malonyl-ACP O-methyltransferase BioC [Gammaproteobacteria bacterium]
MNTKPPDRLQTINKQRARAAFNKAAATYDDAAVLQREVAGRLLERLDVVRMIPLTVVDLGCGTGGSAQQLSVRYKKAKIYAVDFAANMLRKARDKQSWTQRITKRQPHYLCGDAESLPIADNSIDLLYSNLTVQWCVDIDKTLREFCRVLKPGGLLMFSTLGPDTLIELRQSWFAVDQQPHVHSFIDMHHLGDALLQAEFVDPVMDVEKITLTYPDVYKLMRDLKALGARNASLQQRQGLTGKENLKAVAAAYEQFRKNNVLPASYEVVYGHAWITDETNSKNDASKSRNVNVAFSPKQYPT